MEKYFFCLSEEQFEELEKDIEIIGEENEKFRVNAIFFLTTVLESCYKIITLCDSILKTKKFDKNHNFLCSEGVFITNIKRIVTRELLSEKELELKELFPVVDKALELRDYLRHKKIKKIKSVLKIYKYLYNKTILILEELLEKEEILKKYKNTDSKNYLQLTAFLMNSSSLNTDIHQFFIDTFINKTLKIAA